MIFEAMLSSPSSGFGARKSNGRTAKMCLFGRFGSSIPVPPDLASQTSVNSPIMAIAPTPPTGSQAVSSPPKPRDEDLDFYGYTHQGLVRKQNEDNYLLCSLHKTMKVISTSLPNPELLELPSQRLASFSMVADGVGGHAGGETASRAALEAMASYATNAMECFYRADPNQESVFLEAMREAALESHEAVKRASRGERGGGRNVDHPHPGHRSLAPGSTSSRWETAGCTGCGAEPWNSSPGTRPSPRTWSIRASCPEPQVPEPLRARAVELDRRADPPGGHRRGARAGRRDAALHRRPHQARERRADSGRLSALTSSEQACKALVQDALDGGGTDNVTVVVLRAVRSGNGGGDGKKG